MTPPIPEQYISIIPHHEINSNSNSNDDDDVNDVLLNKLNKQFSPTTTTGSSNYNKNSHINNTNNTTNSNGNGKTSSTSTSTPLLKLQEAINSKLYMVLW